MLTHELIELVRFVDSFVNNFESFSDLINRTVAFLSSLNTALTNIQSAFSWLFFFIPKSYFEPLITIFLLIMLVKCIMAIVNLFYP